MFNQPRKSAAILALVGLLAACQGRFDGVGVSELAPATSDAEKREIRASDTFMVGGRAVRVGWHTLLRSGQSVGEAPNHVFGQQIDDSGKPVLSEDGSPVILDSNDFSSFIPVSGKLFSIAQFESQPGAVYLTELQQNHLTGGLSAVSTRAVDLKGIHGLWNPCAGMVTPWNTHLGSEEYEPDAAKGVASAATMAPFFGGGTRLGGDASQPNPYFYGFPVEYRVRDRGEGVGAVKHYSMGRFAHELSYVLPDRKTVYQSDDGTNVGFFMYLADDAGDLSSGKLYALKWKQTGAPGSAELGEADLSWILLGHASDSDISDIIDSGVTFADIFASAPAANGECPSGFESVNANGVGQECLAVKRGREQAAAFLETRRYAAIRGATTELRKEEGISFDPQTKRLYVAYSEVQYGMEDASKNGTANATYDIGTSNDVKLRFNTCGAIYAYELGQDRALGSDYVAKRAVGVLAGRMTTLIDPDKRNPSTIDAYPPDSPFAGSTCDIDALANPDNISFVTGGRALLIGEDSGDGHQNDAVWLYRLDSRELTRIETTPYGAETTSIYFYGDLDGYAYIASVVQHPFGESDMDKLTNPADGHSYLGYIGPIPVSRDAWR
jgi:secreted PhoX family phosphatase